MKTAVACGGTGGHVFPGLAVAGELESRGHEVCLWLAGKGAESASAAGWSGPRVTIRAEGLRSPASVVRLAGAVLKCAREMGARRPDILLATGGYGSVGPVLAARYRGVPAVIHEANVVPGKAVRFLSGCVSAVAVSFDRTAALLRGRRCVFTGFPVQKAIAAVRSREPVAGELRILVMGGSQGAHAINEAASIAICALRGRGLNLGVVHLAGQKDEETVRLRYEEASVPHRVSSFAGDMDRIYSSVDFAICRAGAATCAELAATRLPALLVPYPFAAHDHQTANARAMEETGLADVVSQGELSADWLEAYVGKLFLSPGKAAGMRSAGMALPVFDAASAIADLLEEIAGRRQ